MLRTLLTICVLSVVVGAQDTESAAQNAVQKLLKSAAGGAAEESLREEAQAVVALGADATTAFLLEGLMDRSEGEIIWSLRCLRNLQRTPNAADLEALLVDDREALRVEALHLLKDRAEETHRGLFLRATRDKSQEVRRRGYDGLVRLGVVDEATVHAAVEGLTSNDFWISSRCIALMKRAPAPRKVGRKERDAVSEALQDALPRLAGPNVAQAFTLAAQRSQSAASRLFEDALKERREGPRLAALAAITRLRMRGHEKAIRTLIPDRNPEVRAAAAGCAAALGDRGAVVPLIDRLDQEREEATRAAIAIALRRITGQGHGYDTRAWREWAQAHPRLVAR